MRWRWVQPGCVQAQFFSRLRHPRPFSCLPADVPSDALSRLTRLTTLDLRGAFGSHAFGDAWETKLACLGWAGVEAGGPGRCCVRPLLRLAGAAPSRPSFASLGQPATSRHCCLYSWCPCPWCPRRSCLPSLAWLDLGGNELSAIPRSLTGLTSLDTVRLLHPACTCMGVPGPALAGGCTGAACMHRGAAYSHACSPSLPLQLKMGLSPLGGHASIPDGPWLDRLQHLDVRGGNFSSLPQVRRLSG